MKKNTGSEIVFYCILSIIFKKGRREFCTKVIYLFYHIYSFSTYVRRLLCPEQKKLASCVSSVSVCVCVS